MVLELEDMNPQPNGLGKIFLTPLNMLNKEMLLSSQPLTIENKGTSVVSRANVQIVKKRSAAFRRRVTIAYKPKFEEFAKQLVKVEVDAVRVGITALWARAGCRVLTASEKAWKEPAVVPRSPVPIERCVLDWPTLRRSARASSLIVQVHLFGVHQLVVPATHNVERLSKAKGLVSVDTFGLFFGRRQWHRMHYCHCCLQERRDDGRVFFLPGTDK